jgi:hypothetical protein
MINMSPTDPSANNASNQQDSGESEGTSILSVGETNSSVITHSTVMTSFQSTSSVHVACPNLDQQSNGLSSSQSSITAGYVANRRIFTDPAEEDTEPSPPLPVAEHCPPLQSRTLARSSSSNLRLSLTDDGHAKIVDRSIPSPEKTQTASPALPKRSAGLRRSYSVAGLNDRPSHLDSGGSAPKVPRVSGRSRDSRTWEFWCDSDARNSLIERADQETSGSAAEAIGMMRSKSNQTLKVNTNKMNSPIPGHSSMEPTKKARPPLKKSLTHVGIISVDAGKMSGKKGDLLEDIDHLNDESDKENRDPVARQSSRLGSFSQPSSKVSGGNDSLKDRRRKQKPLAKERQGHVDKEAASFATRGNQSGARQPREEDLDCIEGLLSLSQGKWS